MMKLPANVTLVAMQVELSELHQKLPANGLVTWTSGNISARLPDSDCFLIKPSGVQYAELTPESMVMCYLDGTPVRKSLSPSSDTATHAFIYRELPDIGAIVHTHSPYATAWAAAGEAIPCGITAMADEFGGPIPLGPFALIGSEEIGRGVVQTLSNSPSNAVLMRSHGVFTVGETPLAALKTAVMCEDVARTMHLARMLGPVEPLPTDDIRRLHERYTRDYGQDR